MMQLKGKITLGRAGTVFIEGEGDEVTHLENWFAEQFAHKNVTITVEINRKEVSQGN